MAISIRRKYSTLDFKPGQDVTLKLDYLDACVKKIQIRVSGAVQTTFASGSPVSSKFSTIGALIDNIQLTANGRVVKSVQPYMASLLQLAASGVKPEQKASAGASALNPPNPTADGPFAFGTTTQYSTVAESLEISLEDRFALGNLGSRFMLNLRRVANAELRFRCSPFTALQTPDDTTVVTYANQTIKIDVTTVEVLGADSIEDFRETYTYRQYPAQSEERIVIPVGGTKLRGIALLVRNGDTTKSFSNNAIDKIEVTLEGGTTIFSSTFQEIQARNRNEFTGLNVPAAAGVSKIDGFCFIDLLEGKNPDTAHDLSRIKNAFLYVHTAAAGAGATYTNPVELLVHFMEYYQLPGAKLVG